MVVLIMGVLILVVLTMGVLILIVLIMGVLEAHDVTNLHIIVSICPIKCSLIHMACAHILIVSRFLIVDLTSTVQLSTMSNYCVCFFPPSTGGESSKCSADGESIQPTGTPRTHGSAE